MADYSDAKMRYDAEVSAAKRAAFEGATDNVSDILIGGIPFTLREQVYVFNPVDPPHYAVLDPQPWDVITAWNLGYLDGSVIKYISRWRNKNGLEDLKKARAFLDHLISIEEGKQ
jgi:hypothetical protein